MASRIADIGGRRLSVRRLGGNRAGEIRLTRFLRNPAVTVEEMLDEAARRTAERCAGRHVVAIQDTTAVRSEGGGGDFLHAVLATDAEDGAILGVIGAQFLARSDGKRAQRRQVPIEHKESFRWLEGADRAASVCAAAARLTVVSDRESDIFEAFALRPEGVDLLVRVAQDRALEDGGRLFAALDAQPVVGRGEINLPAKPGRRARLAKLELRFASVEIARPKNGPRQGLPQTLSLQLVDIRETNPPPKDDAVHWRLLTTHAVSTPAEAWTVGELYRRRWGIEQLFRTMKTNGFDVEHLRIDEERPRNCLITATLIVAACIQQLVHARDGGTGTLRPLIDAFEPEDQALLEECCARLEGKTARQKNPHPKGSLAYGAWVCARLGGWTGYYGKPGPIVMLQGWLEFHAMKRGLSMLKPRIDVPN